jgi:hypothetical protein
MNTAYSQMSVSFNLLSTTRTVNDEWARGGDEIGMKKQLRRGTYADLNLYFLSDLGNDQYGHCYFPETAAAAPDSDLFARDGCVVLAGTVPGGSAPRKQFTGGATAVHEVGHWFGLLHTFEGEACEGGGDAVVDTPLQREATIGCPTGKDSCADSPGLDLVHNYMDYSDDVWWVFFFRGRWWSHGLGCRCTDVWEQ